MKKSLLFFMLLSCSLVSRGQSICAEAITAISGTNYLPATSNSYYWYSYTMPFDGVLQITSSSQNGDIYVGTCSELRYHSYINGEVTTASVSSGEEVFVRWYTGSGGNFEWSLSVSPLEVGEDCVSANTATTGTNSLPAVSDQSYYWYRYNMPSEGKLQITSETSHYIRVYSNTCEYRYDKGSGYGNATITTLSSGDEVFIRWSTYAGGNFDWNVSVAPLETGDNCTLAATATSGTNNLPAVSNQSYWYQYTMPSEGKLQITSEASQYVSVYSGTCDNWTTVGSGGGNSTVTTLNSGDEVLIKWNISNGGNFDWNLSVSPLEAGDDCELAATASTGTNRLPATFNQSYWYRYTMPTEGKLQITSSSWEGVYVYTSCNTEDYEYGYENIEVTTLSSGDEVFIRWSTYNVGNFDWDLSVSPLEEGDACSIAATATIGTNTTPAASYWFEYTVPATGDYTISSVGTATNDTYLNVYSDCSETLIDSDDDSQNTYQSELTLSLAANETIYILWDDNYSSEGFDWTLTTDATTQSAQEITFNVLPTKELDDVAFDLTATSNSGLPVSYTSSDATVATVSGSTVTIIGAGTTTITASQAGDDTYYAAVPIERSFTVNKVSQSVSIDEVADQLVDASPITINASASSGLSLTYSVSGPATISGTEVTLNGTEGIVRVIATQAGDHYYNAASASVSFTVTDPSLQDQTITFEVLPAKTVGDPAFEVTATVSSGLPVTFSSSDETVATVSGNTVTIVGAGTTSITARQAGNATFRAASKSQVLTVSEKSGQTATKDCTGLTATIAETVNVACSGSANGSLTVSATRGLAPYMYSLDGTTFQEAATFNLLDSGKYLITVKDANECTTTVETNIFAPAVLLVSGQVSHSTRSAESGSVTLSVSGGTAPYQYAWSNNATTAAISDLVLGEYSVTVTDASGCSATAIFTVEGVTALEDDPQRQEVAIYPNPVSHVLQIEVPVSSNLKSATLYTLAGRKVAQMNLVLGRNQLDARMLKPGSYLLKLDNGSSQRVVVQ